MVGAAGLAEVALGEFDVVADDDSFDDLWFSFGAGVGHPGGLYVSLSIPSSSPRCARTLTIASVRPTDLSVCGPEREPSGGR